MKFAALLAAVQLIMGTFAGIQDGTIPIPESEVTISFTGDCTIATLKGGNHQDSFNWYAENYEPEYFLQHVAQIFREDDLTLVNCENVLTDSPLEERNKGEGTAYWFRGPSSNAEIFSSSGVELAGIANNHMADYGNQGKLDTIAALEAHGLTVLDDGEPVYIEKNGITLGIMACGLWYGSRVGELKDELREMCAKSDVQIIYPHGGAEGTHQPEEWRKTAFRQLIDLGADIVVGTHAHWLQPMEEYHGGVIVYGLGNFCFGGNNYPQNRTAIYQCTITLTADGPKLKSTFIPCYVYTGPRNNWQPKPVYEDDPVYDKILDFMYGRLESPI